MPDSKQENSEYGYTQAFLAQREAQRKFDYYLLAVTIATLVLSIQTFKSEDGIRFIFLMVFTWLGLILSFLAGLYRQEKLTLFLANETLKLQFKPKLQLLEEAKKSGQPIYDQHLNPWESQALLTEYQRIKEIVDLADERLRKFNLRGNRAYKIQKWLFVASLFSYILFKVSNLDLKLVNDLLNKF